MKAYKKDDIVLAKNLRKEATKWENELWFKFLRNYPIRFQRQKSIGNYIVDFYCAKARLVIELDGYYHTTELQYVDDTKRTEDLSKMNLTVIRFKNTEIENNFQRVCAQIDYIVKNNI
ncbi:MAG: DUF559 domain-containing protein [Ruminococcaceae bacterium]|nr:DUF559 domain-containing protein [Oscillospiraceae bacterium]